MDDFVGAHVSGRDAGERPFEVRADGTAPRCRHRRNAAHDGAALDDDVSVSSPQRPGVADIEITHGDCHMKSVRYRGIGGEIETGAPCRTGVGGETVTARVLDTLLD